MGPLKGIFCPILVSQGLGSHNAHNQRQPYTSREAMPLHSPDATHPLLSLLANVLGGQGAVRQTALKKLQV